MTMKYTKYFAFMALLNLSATDVQGDISIIVHPSNNEELALEDIERIYIGRKKRFSNGAKIVAINMKDGSSGKSDFNSKILNKTDRQMKAYWSKKIFTGKGTPPIELNYDAALKRVSEEKSAIAYISADKVTESVKVVARF